MANLVASTEAIRTEAYLIWLVQPLQLPSHSDCIYDHLLYVLIGMTVSILAIKNDENYLKIPL